MRPVRPAEEVDRLKQRILSQALAMITREGFQALSMRGLAKQLNMTAPNLYNYFASKDEIYITLMIQGFKRLRQVLEQTAAVQDQTSALERARAVLHAYLDFGLTEPHYYELMFSVHAPKYHEFKGTAMEKLSLQEHDLSMEIAGFADTCLQQALQALERPLDAGQRRDLLVELWSLTHGMISLHLAGNSIYLVEGDATQAYGRILDQHLSRLLAVPGGRR